MIKIDPIVDKYCSKCGRYEHQSMNNTCCVCNTTLSFTKPLLLVYKCDVCGEKVEATYEYFVDNLTCPTCKEGELFNISSREVNQSTNFKIDGVWNGGNVGKKIQQKNEQLKKVHEGYSYENQNLREKVSKQTEAIYGTPEIR